MSIDAMDAEGDHDHEGETEDQVEGLKKNPHKHDSGAADLEKVTDYVEEQELASHVAQSFVSSILDKQAKTDQSQAVKIRKEDIELIVNEMEVSKQVAEKKLRQHNGNVKEALKAMLAV